MRKKKMLLRNFMSSTAGEPLFTQLHSLYALSVALYLIYDVWISHSWYIIGNRIHLSFSFFYWIDFRKPNPSGIQFFELFHYKYLIVESFLLRRGVKLRTLCTVCKVLGEAEESALLSYFFHILSKRKRKNENKRKGKI